MDNSLTRPKSMLVVVFRIRNKGNQLLPVPAVYSNIIVERAHKEEVVWYKFRCVLLVLVDTGKEVRDKITGLKLC